MTRGKQSDGGRWWFTGDEHYYHSNIIEFCSRPFAHSLEMKVEMIECHNEVVGRGDMVVHAGDFSWGNKRHSMELLDCLNGTHIILRGSHDKWLGRELWTKGRVQYVGSMYEHTFEGNVHVTVCHYAMRTWPRSHFNSWHLYGHSHGRLPSVGKSMDVGVDTNNYYPYSFEAIAEIMATLPDNFNYKGER